MLNVVNVTPERDLAVGRLIVDCIAGLACAMMTAVPRASAQEQAEPRRFEWAGREWAVHVQYPQFGQKPSDARVNAHAGREGLWLRSNTHVVTTNRDFQEGVIEFDFMPTATGDFLGFMFHWDGFGAHDLVYARPNAAHNAYQYAPRIRGVPTFRLYPQYDAADTIPRDAWTRVRIEVRGRSMRMFLDGAGAPVMEVPRLESDVSRGGIGFWARVNDRPDEWAGVIANLRVSLDPPPDSPDWQALAARATAFPEDAITDWEVAGPLPPDVWPPRVDRQVSDWTPLAAEPGGLVNFTRRFGQPAGFNQPNIAMVRTRVARPAPEIAVLEVSASDDVMVFLNGRPLFEERNGFGSRYPGYLGYVRPGATRVFLALEAGENEIIIAVRNLSFGWGLRAQLHSAQR